MNKILWVDEEVAVAFPDMLDLRFAGYFVENADTAPVALDHIIENKTTLHEYVAIVIDIQLPFDDDLRFVDPNDPYATFAGLKICDEIRRSFDNNEWEAFRKRTLLYTRLPNTRRMERIRKYASENNLSFVYKSGTESLLSKLRELKLIK